MEEDNTIRFFFNGIEFDMTGALTMQQHLDTLKEPLASEWMPPRAGSLDSLDGPCPNLATAITHCDWGHNDRYTYWSGVMNFFDGSSRTDTVDERQRGYDDAKKSAPEGYVPPDYSKMALEASAKMSVEERLSRIEAQLRL